MLQEFHCPLTLGSEAVRCSRFQEMTGQLPQGREVVYGRSATPHCPQAMRQCEAGFPLPKAPKRRGSVLHCPLPSAHNKSATGHTQCGAVLVIKQCGTTQEALMVQRGMQGAVDKKDPLCLHTGIGRAVPARCGSALVQLCNNTLTHSAHTTHTPLPVYLYPCVDIPAIAFW